MFTTFTTCNRELMCVQENRTRQRSGGEGQVSRLHKALLKPNRNMSNIILQWAKYLNRCFIKEDIDIDEVFGTWE